MQDIAKRLRELVALQFDIREDRVPMQGRLTDFLPFDSLETVELVMAIEETFGVEIDDHDVSRIETFDDLLACITASLDRLPIPVLSRLPVTSVALAHAA